MTDLNEYLDLAVKALNGPHGEAGVRAIAKLLRQLHCDLTTTAAGPGWNEAEHHAVFQKVGLGA